MWNGWGFKNSTGNDQQNEDELPSHVRGAISYFDLLNQTRKSFRSVQN